MILSIIITVYNREKYISRCIESALNQEINDYEIVIVNDGSTDNSEEIIKKYIQKYPNKITYCYQKNQGVAVARNKGIELAHGKYITYIDSDDYVKPNAYKEICEKAIENDYDIVIYDAEKENKNGKEYMNAIDNITVQGEISKEQYIISMPCPWNKIIKRYIVIENKLRFPEGICYEDLAMIPLVGQYTNKIYYLRKPVINYYQSSDSIMRQNEFKDRYLDIFKALEFLKNNMKSKYNKEVEYIFWENLLVEFSLIFYKYNKYDLIKKCSEVMRENFKYWEKNKYIKRESLKKRIYSYVFFFGKYRTLKAMQYIKYKLKIGGHNDK